MPNADEKTWYIFGAGGFGLEVCDIVHSVLAANEEKFKIEFLVDCPETDTFAGIRVRSLSEATPGSSVTIALGEPAARHALRGRLVEKGLKLKSAISPSAFVSRSAKLGKGCIVAPLSSIQSQAKIGVNVAVNTQAIVGHHVGVGADASISSQVNLGGAVKIGRRTYIGMGALLIEKTIIGSDSILGMGSVLYKDIPNGVIATGNPARVVRRNENKKVFK
jgi:sugar O-acyltransferase (sialic acid O-acetyltransferase NeuD family)